MIYKSFSTVVVLSAALFFLLPALANAAVLAKAGNNSGLVGYWNFNEGAGNRATDFSGQGNSGTFVNSPAWVVGKHGAALSLVSSDSDQISIADPASGVHDFGTGDFTISVWIKTSSTADNRNLIHKGAGAGLSGWRFGLFSGIPNILIGDTSTFVSGNLGSIKISDGAWHHMTVVYDRDGNAIGYIDGVSVGTTAISTITGSVDNTSPILIRANTYGGFSGLVDDMRIYNRALTAAEVAKLYQAGSSRMQTANRNGLVGEWKFDEGVGTNAGDMSGRGNAGTLVSNPTWINGKHGKALYFDGSDTANNQTVTVPMSTNPELNILGDVTIAAWIKPSSSYFDAAEAVLRNGQGANLEYSMFYDPANKRPYMQWYDGAFKSVNGTTNSVPLDQWSHVTIVRSGTTASFYVNGVFTNSDTVTAPTVASNSFAIGRTNNVAVPQDYSGAIDEMRIYNRALSTGEIQALYQSGATKINVDTTADSSLGSGLVGYWSFNGPDVTDKVYDRSGQGNDAYFVGSATSSAKTIGKIGQALTFNSANANYVKAGTVAVSMNSFTASAWIKTTSTGDRKIISNNILYHPLQLFTGGVLRICVNGCSAGTTPINDGNWHFVIVEGDTTSIRAYIDGNITPEITQSAAGSSMSGTLNIGAVGNGSPSLYWNGAIDDVRIYNRALSAAEIKQLYTAGK